MNFKRKTFITAALLAAAGAACAQATITHDKALAGSVTPGDTAGYPITISQPGSYKLMGNLVVPANVDGIKISADGVTLDLNGFSIIGTGVCTQDPASLLVTCTGTGLTRGIAAESGLSVTVRNGSVKGFNLGVKLDSGTVDGMSFRHNEVGIYIPYSGTGFVAARNSSAELGIVGFQLPRGSIQGCLATRSSYGIYGSINGLTVVDSVAASNATGISDATIHSTRSTLNKLNLSNTAAF